MNYVQFFCFKTKEQLAAVVRALIEASRLEQLANIEAKRKAALARLNIKYVTADQVKHYFGFIGVLSLSSLWIAIILNDLAKIFRLFYKIAKNLLKEKREIKEKKRKEERVKKIEQVNLEMDEEYSRNLEEKLSQIHSQLVKACARRKAFEIE